MVALSLIGLKHGLLIGLVVGLISFVPYLGSLTGLVVSTCVAIAQFWPNWLHILIVPAIFFVGQSLSDYVLSPYFVGRRVNFESGRVLVALFAFGHLFRLCWPRNCSACRGSYWRAHAVRFQTVLRKPALFCPNCLYDRCGEFREFR